MEKKNNGGHPKKKLVYMHGNMIEAFAKNMSVNVVELVKRPS